MSLQTDLKTLITPNKRPREEDYASLSKEELICLLKDRDSTISKIEGECKKLKRAAPAEISPEKAREKADKLRTHAYRGIKSQMKWKPSCKHGSARFSYTAMCSEPTFRQFMNLEDKDKTKGQKMEADDFEPKILGQYVSASIRYGYLSLKGTVNVTFSPKNSEIKITGGYGI